MSPIVGHRINIQLLQVFSLSDVHSRRSHPILNPLPVKLCGQRWDGETGEGAGTGRGC